MKYSSIPVGLPLIALLLTATALHAGSLEEDFRNPPVTTRPYVWWHWMGPNFSKEGITKDLEAMKASGIGGATIFNLTSAVQESAAPTENNPWPDQTYRSPKYWEALRHAAAEADRLGLEIGMHNTVGYSTTGGPWIDEARSMQRLVWTRTEINGGDVTTTLPKPELGTDRGWDATGRKLTFYQDVAVQAVPADATKLAVGDVIDLTKHLSADGSLRWNAPAGKWAVYRIGHASTGYPPHPSPDDVLGKVYEVDKMSLEQTRYHWETVIHPIKEHLGPLLGKSFRHFLIDSYESDDQNWTPLFREEFKKRKGYDPLPWLPTMYGKTIGTDEETARFKWDFQDMVSTLFYENGWEPAAKMIHAAGCQFQWEPYGGPFDTVEGTALADLPMGEFWTTSKGSFNQTLVSAGRAAGRRVIGAEAFTGWPTNSKWTETPGFLKVDADGAFGIGVNRMVLHHWVHQPFDDRYKPGMGMGWWGTHFGRNQTWAELGKEFYRYLGRCQALLQRGESPSDYVSVGSPHGTGDVIPRRMFLSGVRVEDGKIVLPSGRRYEFIYVPHDGRMLPQMARQIQSLLAAGAKVVANKPHGSPSLVAYPNCDDEVKAIAAEIWDKPTANLFTDINAAIRACDITPAARIVSPKSGEIRIQHRRDKDAEWFFVANLSGKQARFTVSFKVAGMTPELWDAETCTIMQASSWRVNDGRTEVALGLGSVKSIFVVFRPNPTEVKHVAYMPVSESGIEGPWSVGLAGKEIVMDKLASLTEQSDPDVKYFSGTATYQTTFKVDAVPERLHLDLGDVRDLVRVTVNGRDCGVWWHPPYARDITSALKPGENTLALEVCNTWHNRLVGDEQFPADFEWGADRGIDHGRALKAYPDWFVKNQPRPEQGRKCFVNWYYHRKDTPLIPSGLLGPVKLVSMAKGVEEAPAGTAINNTFLRQNLTRAEDLPGHAGGGSDAEALFDGLVDGESLDDGRTFRGYGNGNWLTLHLKQPCDITGIETFAAHVDARASQRYNVFVAHAGDPGKFEKIAEGEKYAAWGETALRLPVKANQVVAVRFEFADGPDGFNVYREINLVGSPSKNQ